MRPTQIRPIPKYMLKKIQRLDRKHCPDQKGLRMYSYLTTINKDLVKITVAVKTHKKQWYCKQVAVHGVKSERCWVRDMEYQYMGMGYRVGWYDEGLVKYRGFYNDGVWYDADSKYYNPWSTVVNREYVERFPKYKHSGYEHLNDRCVIQYLKLYTKYPQTEYLLKLGLLRIAYSKMILTKVAKDKRFCKWLIANRVELANNHRYYIAGVQDQKTNGAYTAHTGMQEKADARKQTQAYTGTVQGRY